MTKPALLTFEAYDDWDQTPMETEYEVYNLPHGAELDTLAPQVFDKVEAFAFKGHDPLGAKIMDALEGMVIRAAALDVFMNEPHIDPRFMALNNVLLSPHQSSGTIETRKIMG